MIFDKQAMFSEAQVVDTDGGSGYEVSSNVYNAGAAVNLGGGEPKSLLVNVTAITSAPSLSLKLIGASDEACSANRVEVLAVPAYSPAAGSFKIVPIPPAPTRQYYRVEYVLADWGDDATVTCGIVRDADTSSMVLS